jgi:bifunctional non-homologous end joining protein LigD
MPYETVIVGEIVAVDESGRPSFNSLQNYAGGKNRLLYYVFDVLVLSGQDLLSESLLNRREMLQSRVLSRLGEPIRESPTFDASLADLVRSVKAQGLEGLVAKRRDSRYEAGMRSGAWQKMRVNQEQEFVIGGYTRSANNFDALIFGYYEGNKLMYVARTRNGFTPSSRASSSSSSGCWRSTSARSRTFRKPEAGRWGQGLTAGKMKECRWLKPVLVGQFDFLEWTPDNHLRHASFRGIRADRNAIDVTREPKQ